MLKDCRYTCMLFQLHFYPLPPPPPPLSSSGVQKYYEEADLVQYLLNGLTNEPVHVRTSTSLPPSFPLSLSLPIFSLLPLLQVVKVAFADLARELGLKGKCETEIMK